MVMEMVMALNMEMAMEMAMELVEIIDGTVKVRLMGACSDCSMSMMTLKAGLEEAVKKVDEVSYHLYNVELLNRYKSKEKSKLEIKDLLEQILINETILNEDIKQKIQQQINNY
jgi:hypothetical protein